MCINSKGKIVAIHMRSSYFTTRGEYCSSYMATYTRKPWLCLCICYVYFHIYEFLQYEFLSCYFLNPSMVLFHIQRMINYI